MRFPPWYSWSAMVYPVVLVKKKQEQFAKPSRRKSTVFSSSASEALPLCYRHFCTFRILADAKKTNDFALHRRKNVAIFGGSWFVAIETVPYGFPSIIGAVHPPLRPLVVTCLKYLYARACLFVCHGVRHCYSSH